MAIDWTIGYRSVSHSLPNKWFWSSSDRCFGFCKFSFFANFLPFQLVGGDVPELGKVPKTYWRFGISQQPHRISHRTFYFKWLSSHSLRYSASGYVRSSSTIWTKHETALCPFGWLFHSPSPHTQSCLRLSTSLEPVDPSFPVNGALELNSTFFTLYATLKSPLPPPIRPRRKEEEN